MSGGRDSPDLRPSRLLDSGSAAGTGQPPAVEFRNVTRRFGTIVANAGVSFCVGRGTIHGLIGENGAGKSTAMRILYGLLRQDGGQIVIHGIMRSWSSPADAIAQGIGMVHQHFMLAEPFTALDNIILGAEPTGWGFLDRGKVRARLEALASQYGLAVDWNAPIEELPVGVQQRIEILKLLYREAEILILDEPTAVLSQQETTALFENLKRLKKQGKTILLVTHKLKEVLACTDRVTVLRDGRVAGEFETSRTTVRQLAGCMIGRPVSIGLAGVAGRPESACVLELTHLTVAGKSGGRAHLQNVGLSVRRGEIVGIAGVEGNGQSELLGAVLNPSGFGGRLSGGIEVLGREVRSWTAVRIKALGVACIPEDRQRDAILPQLPVTESFLLGLQRSRQFSRAGFVCWEAVRKAASEWMAAFDVRPCDATLLASQLSGGNQQKLVVARELSRKPALLLAAQPTRGVDIGAIELIHRRILQARDSGAGVLLFSSEIEELINLADRILVLFTGQITGEFQRGGVTEQELGLKIGGG